MASYSLEIKRSAASELRQMPPKDQRRVVACIQALAMNPKPPGAEKLSGQERYRVRQGDYRILYEIEHDALRIMMVKIGHRRDVHRD